MWPFSKKKALELPDFWWAYEEHFKEKLPENIHENIFVVLIGKNVIIFTFVVRIP